MEDIGLWYRLVSCIPARDGTEQKSWLTRFVDGRAEPWRLLELGAGPKGGQAWNSFGPIKFGWLGRDWQKMEVKKLSISFFSVFGGT